MKIYEFKKWALRLWQEELPSLIELKLALSLGSVIFLWVSFFVVWKLKYCFRVNEVVRSRCPPTLLMAEQIALCFMRQPKPGSVDRNSAGWLVPLHRSYLRPLWSILQERKKKKNPTKNKKAPTGCRQRCSYHPLSNLFTIRHISPKPPLSGGFL